ncbi:hypothetical protein A3715_12840 [Oleiphilus sp. HI0009]|uniref:hypothetical protein n=2 Tax=Oleiphilus TaxID=141450 RepID=UPI0007C32D72|nr:MULTISPECIES: hypothetical protein [unclassified Oleiphilus]KZX76385.1 hypothetical protein A3715_12840 [Oleiphilus sp. HI0009]MCH2157912.1 hypothetical protein [Oleiphilaceae bacterium]KZY69939.1 hypothetical protein A3738_15560 [Oleiphilus sp. HI0066]KZY70828.1 hypothetical protein A3738_24265 [Oleiphilus sp. HI0066]KZY71954.1 hypothetical protein A3739_03540 [Oleiphilus sp. HI0067]
MNAITILLVLVGLINLAPILGLLGAAKLNDAYAIKLVSNDLILLMRHRALLFGILGGFILYAAFEPKYQSAAMLMALISMAGFLVLMLGGGEYNAALKKVMLIDIVGIVLLGIAAILKFKPA